ncbi:MAG: hypothetical protein LBG05_10875 [Treponema sp.]|jgi:exonuclease SbcC|nr:hypothetical protein [Treponema sp.]
MSVKVLHLADIHFSSDRKDLVISCLRDVEKTVKENPVDVIAIAGDVFDSAVLNSGSSELPRFIESIKRLGDLAPTVMVYGTPSHDVDQSLDIFKTLNTRYGITILEPGQAYFLAPNAGWIFPESEANRYFNRDDRLALIFGIPEPRKKYLLADTSVGKDETEEAIREAMHKMCFLLAAKRQEYSSMTCLVLYHGDVAGSVLQNDQTVERGTGIAITVDDLGDIGADYYALGHIHKPQRVGNLPAYYAGSITRNFGEQHKAGYNLVCVDKGSHDLKRIDWPIPQNMKIEIRSMQAFKAFSCETKEISGKKVWVEISCTKEERALIDTEKELSDLIESGAVDGSRVTISDIPVETVRAAEITEASTPAKKFEIWAENSDIKVEETLLKKITSLEDEITLGAVRVAGEWELVSLRLRGAIGIKKGIHKDEIFLDFDDYADGLIALTGANGRGKTTLIENCHAYPQLLTRDGKLQSHFFLRDSFREVIYRNRAAGGKLIKFLIQIDGQNKSGSCKYFVFDASGYPTLTSDYEWVPRPGVDGNLKPYQEVLSGIFGPMELYLRTAFITQRPTKNLPDLVDATAGEKKALFVELAGIDYLQRFADAAAEKAKQEAAKNHDAEIKARMLETEVNRRADEECELHNAEEALKKAQGELAGVTEQGKAAKAEVDRLQEAFNAEKARQEKENEAQKAVDRVQDEIDTLDAEKTRYQDFVKNKSVYEKEIAEHEALQKTVEAENEKKRKVLEANSAKQQEYSKNLATHNQKVKAIETECDNLCNRRNSLERLVFTAQNNIKLYERDAAEIKDNCPACGQRLPPEKLSEMKIRRDQFVAKIEKEKVEIQKLNGQIEGINKQIETLTEQVADLSLDEPAPVRLAEFNDSTLRTATAQMNQINIAQNRTALTKVQEAAVRIEGLEKQIEDKLKLLEKHKTELVELKTISNPGFITNLEYALSKHALLTERYTTVKAEIARQEATIGARKRNLAAIEDKEKELEAQRKQIFDSKHEGGAWELIAKAFGRDGIQALELDALAPGISDTANKILEKSYGSDYRISIETTRIGGAGKKTKQIEDFLIKITHTDDGEETLLENMSGGQQVWIKKAIYDAFSIIRKRNSNFVFNTAFIDECDGALDPDSKLKFFRMLDAYSDLCNLRHVILITHSEAIKEMISQRINIENL